MSHAGLLEDGGAALRKKNAELGTALAQSNVTIRQLEDRLRSLQVSRKQEVGAGWRVACTQVRGRHAQQYWMCGPFGVSWGHATLRP